MSVSLVIVSHSASLAAGVVEVAREMAPAVTLVAAGGTDDGIGTSFDRVTAALVAADGPDGIVVLYDLGSALLTTETAVEFLDEAVGRRIRVVDAPLVEAAIEAAVAAQGGADLDRVVAAARSAGQRWPENAGSDSAGHDRDDSVLQLTAIVRNPQGVHARPASVLARELAAWQDTEVHIGRNDGDWADARQVLAVVGLGLAAGEQVLIRATGIRPGQAADLVAGLFADGFGELGSE